MRTPLHTLSQPLPAWARRHLAWATDRTARGLAWAQAQPLWQVTRAGVAAHRRMLLAALVLFVAMMGAYVQVLQDAVARGEAFRASYHQRLAQRAPAAPSNERVAQAPGGGSLQQAALDLVEDLPHPRLAARSVGLR